MTELVSKGSPRENNLKGVLGSGFLSRCLSLEDSGSSLSISVCPKVKEGITKVLPD